MTKKSQQIFDDTPPIPALSFAKGKAGGRRQSEDANSAANEKEKPSVPSATQERQLEQSDAKRKVLSKPKKTATIEEHIYDGYSTQLRTDIQKQLKRLKNVREEAKHPVCTVKQFFELAIIAKLKGQDLARNTVSINRETNDGELSYRPFRTEIRRDLLRQIKRWKYDQEESGDNKASIKSFLESAILAWLQ